MLTTILSHKRDHEGNVLPSNQKRLAIAVDLGAVTTSVALLHEFGKDQPGQIYVFEHWPGGNTKRIPTRVQFDEDGNVLKFGAQLMPSEDAVEFFKLGLDAGQPLPDGLTHKKIKRQCARAGKTVEGVVVAFLAKIHETVTTSKDLEARFTKQLLFTAKLEWILTVPAIWTDSAKDIMSRAAQKAGMVDAMIISEPEAAAIYTIGAKQSFVPAEKETFVVCDIGGATIDIVTYRIWQMSPLHFCEVVVGQGATGGGYFLDIHFQTHLKNCLGEEAFGRLEADDRLWKGILDNWQRIKDYFDASSDDENRKTFYIRLGRDFDNGSTVQGGDLTLSCDDIRAIFQPTVKQVTRLINSQCRGAEEVNEKPTRILLVGGGGQWPHMYSELCALYNPPNHAYMGGTGASASSKRNTFDMEVQRPLDGPLAIVQGAAWQKFHGGIVSHRKARRGYALMHYEKWDQYSQKHRGLAKILDPVNKRYNVKQPDFLFRKGSDVPLEKVYTKEFYREFTTVEEAEEKCKRPIAETLFTYNGYDGFPRPSQLVKLRDVSGEEGNNKQQQMLENAIEKYEDERGEGVVEIWYVLKVSFSGDRLKSEICFGEKSYAEVEDEYVH
ncbi:Hsp70 protein-like protein 2 [Elsinoe fawcettii]|nr:Hsp70 protein-like protein 2 [Elsinoe fawcettii]